MWAVTRWISPLIQQSMKKMVPAICHQGDQSQTRPKVETCLLTIVLLPYFSQLHNYKQQNSQLRRFEDVKVCWEALARVGWNCWLWWMNTLLNNGAAVSFKSATTMAAGPNLCGRGERQFGTLTGRVNLRTKTNKRHNGRNKARCLANLTGWIIFPNVPLLLSHLRHAVARPRATILTVKTCLALKCSEPLCPCPHGRASHSDCGSSYKASQRQPMWSLQGCFRIVSCLRFSFLFFSPSLKQMQTLHNISLFLVLNSEKLE